MDQVQRAQDWNAGGKYGLILLALSGGVELGYTNRISPQMDPFASHGKVAF
ncbi:MAG: hypothetical protein ACN6PV_15800 [Achromobacter sp.]|uniref:hypothetical protein n=1 Tax=Achromobacter sp. TaxID=134375 RepID=UPI003D021038